jgi:hypothetical protein
VRYRFGGRLLGAKGRIAGLVCLCVSGAFARSIEGLEGIPAVPAQSRVVAPPASATPSPTPLPAARPKLVVTGVVVDAAGKPVKGALVYTLPQFSASTSPFAGPTAPPWRASEYRSTSSAEDGSFVIESTRAPFNLRAEAPPLAPAEILNVTPGAPLTLRLTAGLTQAGRVFHVLTGEPMAGLEVQGIEATMRMLSGAVETRPATALTDREGRFVIRGLRPRTHGVALKSTTFLLASYTTPFLPGSKDLALNVRPGTTWSGRVTDTAALPIKGARVALFTAFNGDGPSTQTDAQGRFSIAVRPGRYTVKVTHADFAPVTLESKAAVLGTAEKLAIEMSPGVTARGRIVDEEGKPLKGRVRLRLLGQPMPLFAAQDLGDPTDESARFSLAHLPVGEHEVDFLAAAHALATVPLLVAAHNGIVDMGDVRLESGLAIAGRVVDQAGDPVAGARLRVNASRDAARSEPFEAVAEDDGRFVIPGIKEGRYVLSASAEGYSNLDNQRVGSGDQGVRVTMQRVGGVRFRLVQGAGALARPVTDSVSVTGQAQTGSGSPTINPRIDALPNESGEVAFEKLNAGRQLLDIAVTGYVRRSLGVVNVEPGKTADLGEVRLDRGFTVRGSVVDSGGRPIPGADVEAIGKEANRMFPRRAVSGADGRFEITGVEPGSVEILASHAAYATAREAATIDPDGSSADALVVLRAGGRITGSVKKRSGEAVRGAFVSYFDRTPMTADGWKARAETDAAGGFAFENVPPGDVSVAVLQGKAGRFEGVAGKTVRVEEGEESTISFTLRETVVRGRVSGPAARANLRVRLSASLGGAMYGGGNWGSSLLSAIPRGSALTRSDGGFELMVDQPGRYFVEIASYDGSETLIRRPVEVPDVDVFPLDFVVGASRVVVTVLDEATRSPVADASVGAVPARGPSPNGAPSESTGISGADGRAVLYLSDGEYRLVAQSPGYATESVATRVGGDSEVTLTLWTGLKIAGRVHTESGGIPPGYYVTAGLIGGGPPRQGQRFPGGAFEIAGLRSGRYRIHASAADDFGEAEAEAGAENVDIVLRPGGAVSVLVVDAANKPVNRATVVFSNDRGEPLSNIVYYTDNAGRLREMPMPAQPVVVAVSLQGLAGKATVTPAPGERVEVRVVLEPLPVK